MQKDETKIKLKETNIIEITKKQILKINYNLKYIIVFWG
jgi:hypothetical protein